MASPTKPFLGTLQNWAIHGYRSTGRRYFTGDIRSKRTVTSYVQSMEQDSFFVRGLSVETLHGYYILGDKR